MESTSWYHVCVKRAVHLESDDTFKNGLSILDITLKEPTNVAKIQFKNYYTAWLSMYIKKAEENSIARLTKHSGTKENTIKQSQPSSTFKTKGFNLQKESKESSFNVEELSWEVAFTNYKLMDNPHYEEGSQSDFSIHSNQSLTEWNDLVKIRLLLMQPSTVWKTFRVECVKLIPTAQNISNLDSTDLEENPGVEDRLTVLMGNTKRILQGQVIEPEEDDNQSQQ